MPVDAAHHDLDQQIASVLDCKFLMEDEVIRLCEKVSTKTRREYGEMLSHL